jgi:hypothetical protein
MVSVTAAFLRRSIPAAIATTLVLTQNMIFSFCVYEKFGMKQTDVRIGKMFTHLIHQQKNLRVAQQAAGLTCRPSRIQTLQPHLIVGF